MKKTIYTSALVALFALAGNAQDNNKKKAEEKPEKVKVETVNPDGTTTTTEVNSTNPVQTTTPPKKSGTRMAVTQKGTPGSSKNVKEEKASPTQPK